MQIKEKNYDNGEKTDKNRDRFLSVFMSKERNRNLLFIFHQQLRIEVTVSSVWAFADTSGLFGVDSANYAVVFFPLLPTAEKKEILAVFSESF